MSARIRIVQIIPDDRDVNQQWDYPCPVYGPAPAALLEGFASLVESCEVHVVSCVRREMPYPSMVYKNVFVHQLHMRGGYTRSFFYEPALRLRSLIRGIGPDVVHGQGTETYAAWSAVMSGYPSCVTIHGNMRAVARKLHYRPYLLRIPVVLMEWQALRRAGRVFCNSGYTEDCVGRLSRAKVRVPNAVSGKYFDVDRSCVAASVPPKILCIGHIQPYKNQVGLIHALDRISDKIDFRVVFIGSCDAASAYGRSFLGEVQRRSWCEYRGRLSKEEIIQYLSISSGLIHASHEESFGLVVAEALAAGVPVAVSCLGGLSDIVRDGETGICFNPHEPDDICRAFLRLLDLKDFRALCENGKMSTAHFHPNVVARMHLDIYKEFVSTG
jgi:glycosyltransferase involved in cell wall biosynthesis